MKLELLLKREDFYKIFAETLSNYLIKYQNWTGSIYISSKRNKTAKNLFINKHTYYQRWSFIIDKLINEQ